MSYDSVAESFISRMGLALESQGLPRIAGQIFALLILRDEAPNLKELAEELAISHGSASANTRLLESIDLIERFTPRGERRMRHRISDDPFPRLVEGSIVRMDKLASIIREARVAIPPSKNAAADRLTKVEGAFGLCADSLRKILAEARASGGR